MSSDHYTNYVEKLQLIFTAEPTENLLLTLYPTPYPTAFINRMIEPSSTNSSDIILMIVAISIATSTVTTICIVCGGIYCYYLRNHLKRQYLGDDTSLDYSSDDSVSSTSSEKIDVFELDDIYWSISKDTENPQILQIAALTYEDEYASVNSCIFADNLRR